jgi:KaiC/GvpD/RAD55 family RecA-like ATPase
VVSVLKMRFSDHDRRLREFTITDRGIAVLDEPVAAEGLLTGLAPEAE